MEGAVVVVLIAGVGIVCSIIAAINNAKLLKDDPQAWAAKRLVEEEVKRRKRESHANIGIGIARAFFRK